MQIAGTQCSVCNRSIVIATEGKSCPGCGRIVHCGCEPSATCSACGKEFQGFDRPSADPLRDALVPRALRQGGSSFQIGVVLVLFILVFVFCVFLGLFWNAN